MLAQAHARAIHQVLLDFYLEYLLFVWEMADEPISSLVKDLKSWCTKHRVKQVELSDLLGVSPQAVNEWFKGRSHPRGELIVRIMEMVKHKPPAGELRQRKGSPRNKPIPRRKLQMSNTRTRLPRR
jgi:hypothetical protein